MDDLEILMICNSHSLNQYLQSVSYICLVLYDL